MKPSTLDQFLGAMTGGLIGVLITNPLTDNTPPWITLQLKLMEQLLEKEQLTLEDWQLFLNQGNCAQMLLTMIPLLLLIHEDEYQWRIVTEKLQNIDKSLTKKLIYVSYGKTLITLALRQQPDPAYLIDQLLLYCEKTFLADILSQIKTFINQKAPLSQVIPALHSLAKSDDIAIALALYSFCSTPEDSQLCVQRLVRSPIQGDVICGLTASLAGVYNGFRGVPLQWKRRVKQSQIGEQIGQKTTQLWGKWAGIYQITNFSSNKTAVITSPLIMQPRSTLSLISYKETLKFPQNLTEHSKVKNSIKSVKF